MNKYIAFWMIGLLLSSCSSNKTVSSDSLNKEGHLYKFKNVLFTGVVSDTTSSGRVLLTFKCVDGKVEGEYLEYYKNGTINRKSLYRNGLKNGVSIEFYQNGKRQNETSHIKGQKTGYYKEYNNSGKLKFKGFYKNWKKDSLWTEYNKYGNIRSKGKYSRGLQTDNWVYYFANGEIEMQGSFKKGNGENKSHTGVPYNGRTGVWIYYTKETSKINAKVEYQNGIKSGPFKTFHDNGMIRAEGIFKEDNYDGQVKLFDKDGNRVEPPS